MPLDVATRAALGARVERLRGMASGIAWVAPENLHLTVKFLGQVESVRLDAVRAAAARAVRGVAPFELRVEGLGAFPTPRRPRVVWAGLDAGADALATVAAGVERELEHVGFPPERRAFSPHVTLGRVREPRAAPRLEAAIGEGASDRFGTVAVERIVLMQSHLSPRGARYAEIGSFPLG